jgi:hypothetical protein
MLRKCRSMPHLVVVVPAYQHHYADASGLLVAGEYASGFDYWF